MAKRVTWNIPISHDILFHVPGDPERPKDQYCLTWVLTDAFTGQSLTYGRIEGKELQKYENTEETTDVID